MYTHPPIRIRLTFSDPTILTHSQRSQGMNNIWLLIEPLKRHRFIHDVINHLIHLLCLRSSCPNGILLFMEGFLLLPSESTQILKDNDIICVKRKVMSLGDAIEGEVNKREPLDNDVLLLANEEFDKETKGYQSESEEEKSEEESSPKEIASKKRKASTKLQSSKKRKKTSEVMDDIEDEVVSEDDIHDNAIHNDACLPTKIISKKTKLNKERRSGESETINVKVKSPSKAKRKKKQRFTEDEVVEDVIDDVNNAGHLSRKINSKKKTKPSEETMKEKSETDDENIKDNVEGVEQASTVPDGAKKGPSRSARRKKAKRQWRRELAKISQNPDIHLEPEVAKTGNKEANGYLEGPLNQDAKSVHKNMVEQKGRNHNGNVDNELVPCVVRPGHIRFEPLDDEDEDTKQTEVSNVAYQWNGITSKKKGQKWGIEKFSTFQRDDSQKASKEPSTILTAEADTQVPVIDFNDLDQLPLYSSPKEGDVIAYRILELSTSWTPELSSFRVGKISHYDGNFVVLMPVAEYPIVFDNMDEDAPENSPFKEDRSFLENSLYKEDGSLEIKFEALVDVRSVKQSNSDATKAPVSNGVNQTPQLDGKDSVSNVKSSSNNCKPNVSKDPNPVVANKGNTWNELAEALSAKKSELLETMGEERIRDSKWNKWSYRALRGSCLGPTMALLRSSNGM